MHERLQTWLSGNGELNCICVAIGERGIIINCIMQLMINFGFLCWFILIHQRVSTARICHHTVSRIIFSCPVLFALKERYSVIG